MTVLRAVLAVAVAVATVQSVTLIPTEKKNGDVVIAFQGSCTGMSPICAPFMAAIWAWEQRLLLVDTSPGSANNSDRPPSFTVGWELRDNNYFPSAAVTNTAEVFLLRNPSAHAEMSMSGTPDTTPSAQLTHGTRHVMLGCALGPTLSDKAQFGYYMRAQSSATVQLQGLVALTDALNVTHLAVLSVDDAYHSALYAFLRDSIPTTVSLYAVGLVYQVGTLDATKWLPGMKTMAARRERYVICFFHAHIRGWIDVAREAGLFTADRQWFGVSSLIWANRDYSHILGAVGIRPAHEGRHFDAWKEWGKGLNASHWPQFFRATSPAFSEYFLQSKFTTFTETCMVDGVFATLFAIERLHAAGTPLSECKGEKLRAEMYRSKFEGIGGPVMFDENGDRDAKYLVWNVVPGTGLGMVQTRGTWIPGQPVVMGGWEGHQGSPDFLPLRFANSSATPWPQIVAGCPRGQRQMGVEEGCAPCPMGSFNPLDDNIEDTCLPCEPGLHGPVEGLSVCSVCPVGSFQNMSGQASCGKCAPGLFADEVGQDACQACLAGSYSATGATHCTYCGMGSFASLMGSTGCDRCPVGLTTEFIGSVGNDACACPVSSLYVPQASPGATNVSGSCFRCNDPTDKGKFEDGLVCPGGRSCEAVPNRTLLRGMPCPRLSDCLDIDGLGCKERCILPLARAQEVCESFDYRDVCHGWSIKTSALRHGDLLGSDTLYGWSNVAELGQVADDMNMATVYGLPSSGFSLAVARRFCAPVASSDPQYMDKGHAKHTVRSFLQPPVMRAGYYMPDLAAVQRTLLPNSRGLPSSSSKATTISLLEQGQAPQAWAAEYFHLLPLDPLAPVQDHPGPVPLFKCVSVGLCPGGQPGQCFPGQIDLNCGRCVKGFYSSSTDGCLKCTGNDAISWLLVILSLAGLLAMVLLYKMTLDPLGAQVSAKMATGLALGLTFNALQTLGVMSLMAIDFPEPLAGMLASFRLVLFDIDQLQWECVADVTPLAKLSARLLAPAFVVVMYQLAFALSRIFHRIAPKMVAPFTVAHTLNCTGMVLQVLFISICMGVILPFKCASQPVNGLATLVDIAYQPCGLGDHNAMAALGVVFIFLYPVFGMASCTYVIYILPRKTAQDPAFLHYFRFLVGRFRFDRYYFGLLFLLRNLGIALVPVLNPSNPTVQQIAMCSTLLAALVAQTLLWPWASLEVNLLDLGCLIAMILTAVLSAGMVDARTIDPATLATAGAWIVVAAFALMAFVVLHGVVKVLATMCVQRNICPSLSQRVQRKSANRALMDCLVLDMKAVADTLHPWSRRHVAAFMEMLPVYDRAAVSKTCGILLGAMEMDMLSNVTKGTSAQMRITVQRYKRRSSMTPTAASEAAFDVDPADSFDV